MRMENGKCVPDCNVKNCAICNPDGTCRYCKSVLNPFTGYEPLPNATDPCPFVCDPKELNCEVTEKMKVGEEDVCHPLGCRKCPKGTVRIGHKCVKCPKGCKNCLDEKQCIQCEEGKVYYKGECLDCSDEGVCGEGEYKEKCKCKKCSDKYKHCETCDDEQCIECIEGFVLAENKTACEPCTLKTCPKNITCSANFSRVGDEQKFDPMCVEHDKDCYCTKCACAYELSKTTHTCVRIPEDQLPPFACGGSDCPTSCQAGYYLDECQCKKNNDCECGKNDDGSCKEKTAIEHCVEVTCSHQCEKCLDGYYLVNKTECKPCLDNCTHCENNNSCTSCSNGFHLNATTGLCDPCTEGCSGTCDKTGLVCESCKDGEYLNDTSGKCESCVACSKCVYNMGKVYCTLCTDGTVPVEGECPKSISKMASGTNGVSVVVAVVAVLIALMF